MNHFFIKRDYLEELFKKDKEIMLDVSLEGQNKDKRPHIVAFKLKYKENVHHFAVPLRSNIPKYRDRKTYHPLPELPKTLNKTREDSIRGIDYSKIFPIDKTNTERIRMNESYKKYTFNYIEKNKLLIKKELQEFIDNYDKQHQNYKYTVDLDTLIENYKDTK